ncbi:phosphopantetheine-binding protein [Kutzneria kofuensis]|uniref:Carrier domain-containing protein n=1 Tax=Kutzneria kofuensis TaxID=103725 RepID=A0A7W9NLB5_9PSEU|nr:phosphopantetheine-binding protein [Kutzneria kofuensis]MBB5896271.1 hypothetical protein [Kutzneria kofuensis]
MDDVSTDLSDSIGELMGEVLVREPLAGQDDFFECGGDSVRAVEVLQRLAEQHGPAEEDAADEFQATLLMAIFEDATPAGLAAVIAGHAR